MIGAIIALALGFALVAMEYSSATAPDPRDKLKRRRPLAVPDKVRLRGLIFVTFMVAGGIWLATWYFE
jgi:hypothetical protein